MKAAVLLIATVNFFYRSTLVASTNDTCSSVQNQYSLRTPEEDSWTQSEKYFGLFRERSSLGITNMFTSLRFLEYVMEDERSDHLISDQAERDAKRVFSRGARQALRQFMLEKTGVPEVL
ncbi:MAG: hypothetical protein Q7R65_02460, partial [bacterium]|nr:hypothetical protein [bacterium]